MKFIHSTDMSNLKLLTGLFDHVTVQTHITSSFYVGIIIMLKLRLKSPVVNLHGISIGSFSDDGIQNLTKVADPNGC